MAWELKEGQGVLWPATKAGRSDRAPHFTGDALIDGKKRRIVAWKKSMRNGGEFLSLAIELADEQRQDAPSDDTPF